MYVPRYPTQLGDYYLDYLRQRDDTDTVLRLMMALVAAGYTLESQLLNWYFLYGAARIGSDWHRPPPFGKHIWVGEQPPTTAEAGDIWFDPIELNMMLLIPRDPADLAGLSESALRRITPFHSWVAFHPLAGWQMRAFLTLARHTPHPTQVAPPFALLDPARLLPADERAPVTRLTYPEAALCSMWLGKTLPTREAWQLTAHLLGHDTYAQLWGPSTAEWVGDRLAGNEAVRVVATLATMALDFEELDDPSVQAPVGMLRGERWYAPEVTFRTSVPCNLGLLPLPPGGYALENISLLDQAPRRGLGSV
jgi:hypothetical protein